MYANARGIRSKIDSLQAAIEIEKPDLIFIVETKIVGKGNIEIKGYKEKILRNRKTDGGGILVAKKDECKANIVAVLIHENEEQVWIKINKNIIIGILYGPIESRTEQSKLEEWYYEIEKEYMKWENYNVMIIGDMNMKIGSDENGIQGNNHEISKGGKILRSLIERRELVLVNNTEICTGLWTREDPSGGKSVLDLVITNNNMYEQIKSMKIDEEHQYKLSRFKKSKKETIEYKSDHNTIMIDMYEDQPKKTETVRKIWNIKNEQSWTNFKNETENIIMKESWEECQNIEESYTRWKSQIKSLMYKHLQRISLKPNKATNPKIQSLNKNRKALSKRITILKKEGLPNGIITKYLIEKQTQLRKEIIEALHEKRIEQLKNKMKNLSSKNNTANKIWSVRRNNTQRNEVKLGIKSKEGILITDPGDINARYKEYYQDLLKNRKTKEEYLIYERKINENHEIYMRSKQYENDPVNSQFCEKDLEKALKQLKKEKAPGPDEIYNEILINSGKNLKINILKMMNTFWEKEKIPQDLYRVEVKSLYKGKGDTCKLENQRGIFLNSIITKFYEKMVLNKGTHRIDKSISIYQAGGRANHSTCDQVFILRSILNLYNYFNQPLLIEFIDLKKAFDKMVLKNIMQNLWESGLRGKIWRVIYNINEKALIKIKTNSGTGVTDEFEMGEILKQGSVIAANLAAMHTDTVTNKFKNTGLGVYYGKIFVPLLLFQDDIVKFDSSCKNLQKSNIILENFQNENKMEYHETKTTVMSNIIKEPKIQMNNNFLPITTEYKYLGDIITTDNRISELILDRKNAISGTIAELVCIINEPCQYSFTAAIQYLNGIIIPKLLLNCESWTNMTLQEENQLEMIHSQSIKRLLHLPYSTPTIGLYNELGIMSIKNQILKRQLMYFHKTFNKPDPNLAKQVMEEQIKLPGKTWLANLLSKMSNININHSIADLEKISKYQWKAIVDKAVWHQEQKEHEDWLSKSTKCHHMMGNKLQRKKYTEILNPANAKLIMEIRLGLLDVKENYHHKYTDTICRNCNNETETSRHFIKCIADEKDQHIIDNIDVIWNLKNDEKLTEISGYLLTLILNNPYFEYDKSNQNENRNKKLPIKLTQVPGEWCDPNSEAERIML